MQSIKEINTFITYVTSQELIRDREAGNIMLLGFNRRRYLDQKYYAEEGF